MRALTFTLTAVALLVLPTAASAEPCRGTPLERFEERLPDDTLRYTVTPDMAQPFSALWPRVQARSVTLRALNPDAVTVYAPPAAKLLIAYRDGACVLAVLRLPAARVTRMIAAAVGQAV